MKQYISSDPNNAEKRVLPKPNLNAEGPAIPCGLIAMSNFNDTFELHYCKTKDCQNP